jgi:hypothetical protein
MTIEAERLGSDSGVPSATKIAIGLHHTAIFLLQIRSSIVQHHLTILCLAATRFIFHQATNKTSRAYEQY